MKEFVDNKELIANDLEKMANLLNYSGLCSDTQPLYDAQGRCISNSTSDIWHYSFEGLKLPIDSMAHTKPVGAAPFDVLLSIDIKGLYANTHNLVNPIFAINKFNIEILGLSCDSEDVYAAWHLDQDAAGDQKFIHPEYHLTFGGHRMWDNVSNYGQVIVIPSPRIAHPPMDAILGIDFILKNFATRDSHKVITDLNEYKQIVQNSIYRLWRPYFSFIGSFWVNPENISYSNFSIFSIMPNLGT